MRNRIEQCKGFKTNFFIRVWNFEGQLSSDFWVFVFFRYWLIPDFSIDFQLLFTTLPDSAKVGFCLVDLPLFCSTSHRSCSLWSFTCILCLWFNGMKFSCFPIFRSPDSFRWPYFNWFLSVVVWCEWFVDNFTFITSWNHKANSYHIWLEAILGEEESKLRNLLLYNLWGLMGSAKYAPPKKRPNFKCMVMISIKSSTKKCEISAPGSKD